MHTKAQAFNFMFTSLIGRLLLGAAIVAVLSGCQIMPPDLLKAPENSLAVRQIESRKFTGISEADLLAASSNVLQDMGFNLENSEVKLGVITANKDREAYDTVEVTTMVLLKILSYGQSSYAIGKKQTIRASIVIKPATSDSVIGTIYSSDKKPNATKNVDTKPSAKGKTADPIEDAMNRPGNYIIRLTLQRVVTKTDQSMYSESIKDPEIYQDFFSKLSKSVFLEAQKI